MNGINNGLYDGLNNGLQNGLFDGNLNGLHNGLNSSDIGFDVDAYKFINQAVITSQLQRNAINYLVKGLKSFNLWPKMVAIYPFIGETSSTHKWNLKDPRDLDAAYRLVFSGGWIHSITGAKPNGVNAYADTFYNVNTNAQQNSFSFSYYSRTKNSISLRYDIGVYQAAPLVVAGMLINNANLFYAANNDNNYNTVANSDSHGFYISSRTASNVKKGYKNGAVLQNVTTTSIGKVNLNFWIGAFNGIAAWGNKECAFAHIGNGLTDAESSILNTIVLQFQTTLGRNV